MSCVWQAHATYEYQEDVIRKASPIHPSPDDIEASYACYTSGDDSIFHRV
jgi:hypothetical protein